MNPTRSHVSTVSILSVVFLSIGILLACGTVDAASLSGWRATAYKHFQNDEYPRALKVLEGHKSDRFAKILITFVHLQEWVYSQSKSQKTVWRGEFKSLQTSVGIKDIEDLGRIARENDKPQSVKYAKKLLKGAFGNVYKNEDVPMLVNYLGHPEPDVSKMAMQTLSRILTNRRHVVKKGGTLRSQDIRMMNNRALIAQLVATVSQEDLHGKPPASPKGISKAIKCLVLIEEPALEYLDKVSGESVIKAKVKVQKAINSRRKKFPKSNWYSATGKVRS